ncbi:MAG: hypothetical protein FWG94_05235 [Oscillospiraceae bacterium]|nr:hypothetical protein [Oscillospiraceae bacterium]
MDELFLITENGNIPIDGDSVLKYNLKRGAKSPFLRYPVADKHGDATLKAEDKDTALENDDHPTILTTSEILDFMQGSDSGDA